MPVERQDVAGLEQAAVEPVDLLGAEEAAVPRHLREQLAEGGREDARPAVGGLRQPLEDALRQQAGVLGEQAEQDPVQEVGHPLRVVAARAEALGDLGEVARRLLGDLGRRDVRAEALGGREDVAEGLEGVGRVVGGQVVEGDDLHDRAQAGEVGVDLDPLEVADHQERRVAEVVLVAHQLDVGGPQVLVLALVLPGEEVALPGVGEAVAAGGLADPLLEGVLGAGRIGLVGGRLAEHPAEVDEVLLRGGLLRGRHAAPLRRERARRQGRLGRHASRSPAEDRVDPGEHQLELR